MRPPQRARRAVMTWRSISAGRSRRCRSSSGRCWCCATWTTSQRPRLHSCSAFHQAPSRAERPRGPGQPAHRRAAHHGKGTHMSDEQQQLRELLSYVAEPPDHVQPPVRYLVEQGRRHRTRRVASWSAAVSTVCAVAIVVPSLAFNLFASIGRRRGRASLRTGCSGRIQCRSRPGPRRISSLSTGGQSCRNRRSGAGSPTSSPGRAGSRGDQPGIPP